MVLRKGIHMKSRKEKTLYPSGGGSGSSVGSIHSSAKSGRSWTSPHFQNPKEKVDSEEQKKFMSLMGGSLKKLKQAKREEEERKHLQEEKEKHLKKLPKMIVPDLGPDFRHEVKFDQTDEGQEEMLRRMARKGKAREMELKFSESRGKELDIEG